MLIYGLVRLDGLARGSMFRSLWLSFDPFYRSSYLPLYAGKVMRVQIEWFSRRVSRLCFGLLIHSVASPPPLPCSRGLPKTTL